LKKNWGLIFLLATGLTMSIRVEIFKKLTEVQKVVLAGRRMKQDEWDEDVACCTDAFRYYFKGEDEKASQIADKLIKSYRKK